MRYNSDMAVQTIPSIDEMTAAQRVELMEALWKAMSQHPEEVQAPDWHGDVLKERERALASGEIEFLDWDDAKEFIRERTVNRHK